MYIDLTNKELFGNDAAEEENPEILSQYFLYKDDFKDFLNPSVRLSFARSRKGMGKSALLSIMGIKVRNDKKSIVISAVGSDLTGLGEFSSSDPATLVNQWQQVICSRIVFELGKRINFAFGDRSIAIVEASELAGFKERNIVSSLAHRLLQKIQTPLGEISKTEIEVKNYAELLKGYVSGEKENQVWFLIDDIDELFLNTTEFSLKLASFFSALRKIVREFPGVNIRASIRTDVWAIISKFENLDKAEQYVVDVFWTRKEITSIVAKRVLAYLERTYGKTTTGKYRIPDSNQTLLNMIFSERFRWKGDPIDPEQLLHILAARRPRWICQLCKAGAKFARKEESEKIHDKHIYYSHPEIWKLRISDLYKEHGPQFKYLQLLIESFTNCPVRFTTKALLDRIDEVFLPNVPNRDHQEIDGKVLIDSISVAAFLFKIGFIQGHKDGTKDYVDFEDRPDLFQVTSNLDDGLDWVIRPTYRKTLKTE